MFEDNFVNIYREGLGQNPFSISNLIQVLNCHSYVKTTFNLYYLEKTPSHIPLKVKKKSVQLCLHQYKKKKS